MPFQNTFSLLGFPSLPSWPHNWKPSLQWAAILCASWVTCVFQQESQAQQASFRAGAAAINIDPTSPESIIAGGFLEGRGSTIQDSLWVRAIVLDDGATQLALVVVDTCMMQQTLIDEAKRIAAEQCGMPTDNMLISATHTHSAPAAMGCLGTRQDEAYAAMLPGKISEAVVAAFKNLQPARIGWGSVDDWEHTHNRRWIRKTDKKVVDPFGDATGLAHMHPGYLSPDIIGPSGPVDPSLSIVSVQTFEGKPLALYANYSQHYFGSAAISADYYGLFCKYIAESLGETGSGNGPFVCALSQGTSGDLMWMDYGSPSESISMASYAESVARYAEKALDSIAYHEHATLGSVVKKLPLRYRVPSESRLKWAEPIAAQIENDLPKSLPEVYAREAQILHQRQTTEVLLQALRIGDLTITALPNEVYALTGLKLRGRSPASQHFNVELANGAEGYIPPPEQHTLGGYTTWPARTAGLEVAAETKIVETLVEAMEQVTGKPRRAMVDEHGPYAQRILHDQPRAYWRMNDEDGNVVRNAVPDGPEGHLLGAYALYLPGPGSGTGIGMGEHLVPSEFSGPTQINRAIQFADGLFFADNLTAKDQYSISYWFWLGEKSGASDRRGILSQGPGGETLTAEQFADHSVRLILESPATLKHASRTKASERILQGDAWNHVTIVRDGEKIELYLNGKRNEALSMEQVPRVNQAMLQCGVQLQGKIDEIAFFDRSLSADEIAAHWDASGMMIVQQREAFLRQRLEAPSAASPPPVFPPEYAHRIASLQPAMWSSLESLPETWAKTGSVTLSPESYAAFAQGRLHARDASLSTTYSLSVWFRNDLPNDARPVTAYLFSRGAEGAAGAPGDHLGIGGHHGGSWAGKLIVFNGNERDQVLAGRSTIPVGAWNHAILIREGSHVRVFLNGDPTPEIEGELEVTNDGAQEIFFGARNDQFAPLQGGMAHVALFPRSLDAEEALALHRDAVGTQEAPRTLPQTGPDPAMPLSPQESLNAIHVPNGFRVELAAAEPNVLDPVAFDWDLEQRLWVVEMADYPLGMDGQGKPGGRIRCLEDQDADGRYETSTLFDEGLDFPTGILCYRGGVLVTAAPKLWYLKDTDGDGRADHREVLFEGFNEGNQQLRMNHLRYGLDGWVYCANGGHHPNHGLGVQVRSHKNGKAYELGSRDFRFQPETGELELESGPSQFGRNRDPWGHWFGTQNASPLWHYVLPDRYLARNPHVASATSIQHVVPSGSPPVYPASPLEKRYHSFEQSGHFTSACSGMIYGDQLLFGLTRSMHAFTCEPFHNVVQHNVIRDDGVSFRASRPVGEGSLDFFASQDRWCRPVMVRTGPDGALWVADMVRYMIEHPDWLPAEGKSELQPHYRLGDDCGRIYRVVPMQGARPIVRVNPQDSGSVAAALDSPNDWQRNAAQQWLLWKGDSDVVPEIKRIAMHSPYPEARLQALYVLDGLEALEPELLLQALGDRDNRLCEGALRLAENYNDAEVLQAALRLLESSDPKVILQLAFSCGEWSSPEAGRGLARIAERFFHDPFVRSAVMSSALQHAEPFARTLIGMGGPAMNAFREPLLRQSAAVEDYGTIAVFLEEAVKTASEGHDVAFLDGMLLELQRMGFDLHAHQRSHPECPLAHATDRLDHWGAQAMATALDTTQGEPRRIAATIPLTRLNPTRAMALDALSSWLAPTTDSGLQAQVIQALAQSGDARVPSLLAEAMPRMTPELSAHAIDAWLSRESWIEDLMARLEGSEIEPGMLTPVQRARLMDHPSTAIAERFRGLALRPLDPTKEEVIATYLPVTQRAGDPQRGQSVYARACASCHQRGTSQGGIVGPNLASAAGHSKEKLLRNIILPSADIQPGYHAYTCLLESGEVVAGVLASETASSISIRQANGEVRSIPRGEIQVLRNSNRSLMPDGLEETIRVEEMQDLLEYLQQPVAQ